MRGMIYRKMIEKYLNINLKNGQLFKGISAAFFQGFCEGNSYLRLFQVPKIPGLPHTL